MDEERTSARYLVYGFILCEGYGFFDMYGCISGRATRATHGGLVLVPRARALLHDSDDSSPGCTGACDDSNDYRPATTIIAQH